MFNKSKKQSTKNTAPEIKCPECGRKIKSENILKAEQKSQKKLQETMQKFGTISIKPEWDVQCNHCSCKITYNPVDGSSHRK